MKKSFGLLKFFSFCLITLNLKRKSDKNQVPLFLYTLVQVNFRTSIFKHCT